jgi:predicted tellurium resistance membrane protein TerC
VIGLAARNLQGSTQKKAILLGTGGAVVLRIIATILVVWLLKVPWLLLFRRTAAYYDRLSGC